MKKLLVLLISFNSVIFFQTSAQANSISKDTFLSEYEKLEKAYETVSDKVLIGKVDKKDLGLYEAECVNDAGEVFADHLLIGQSDPLNQNLIYGFAPSKNLMIAGHADSFSTVLDTLYTYKVYNTAEDWNCPSCMIIISLDYGIYLEGRDLDGALDEDSGVVETIYEAKHKIKDHSTIWSLRVGEKNTPEKVFYSKVVVSRDKISIGFCKSTIKKKGFY